MRKYFILILISFAVNVFPQSERNTKGAANGYSWRTLGDRSLTYSISKENYLSSILYRIKLTKEKHPEISSLDCRADLDELAKQGKSEKISMNDVVNEIDNFYSVEDNLVIPIIFAYCYTIKKIAGAKTEDLDEYRSEVFLFCFE